MDRALAVAILVAIPALAVVAATLTGILPPLAGYATTLAVYWGLLVALTLWRLDAARLRALVSYRHPGPAVLALCILPVLGTAAAALVALASEGFPPAWLVLAAALWALMNGTIEEVFWRGALLPRPAGAAPWIALALFTGWHLSLLAARGVDVTGGALGLLGGAAILGAVFTVARLRSGGVTLGAATHIGVNLFAFTELAVRNQP